MSTQTSPENSRRNSAVDVSGVQIKKFMNGWTKEQEVLMAEWSDIAACYRWLHDKAEKKYTRSNLNITIPVIILSTVTGAANFAVGSIVPADNRSAQQYVASGLGAISIFAGILTTLGNFFQYAQKSESHRASSIAWGKFQRLVQVELAINPMDRIEAMDFLKICRQDLDRLIEQSPGIPDDVIESFEKEFDSIEGLKRPDICHGIEHTRVFDASKARLSKIAADAVLHLRYKKNILSNSVLPDIDKRIEHALNTGIEKKIKELMGHPSEEYADTMTVVNSLETDWRTLLLRKRGVHAAAAPAAPVEESNEVRLHVEGTESVISEVGFTRSVGSEAPTVRPVVEFN
ncbi:SLATT domain-containing protein [bacterium]|nr:SLATT domain-containing protein [bacterium]